MLYPWGNKRRFNAASDYLKKRFGTRLQKVTIDAGFTCPNRDGSKSTGGCAYCNNNAFNPSYCSPDKSIKQQIEEGIEFHETRYKSANRYMAYFQAYSNTYAPLNVLKNIYSQALENKNIEGLIIGTRPDCVNAEILDYIAELSQKCYVVVEYGIESVYDSSLEYINRGHTYADAVKAIHETTQRGINAGAHFILGLPGESRKEILDSVHILSELPLHSIKFHQLQIIRDTRFAQEFEENPGLFHLFELEEYVDLMADYLSLLNPQFIIERLASETQERNNMTYNWKIRYDGVLQLIEKKMAEKDLWQGKYFGKDVVI